MTPSHLGDAISAYLDGELSPAELAAADQHLAACADCSRELEATAHTRAVLRGAPPVEPPYGFIERLLRDASPLRPRRPALTLVGVAAAAALWLVILGATAPLPGVETASIGIPLGRLTASHAQAQRALGLEPISTSPPALTEGFGPISLAELRGAPYAVPASLGEHMTLVQVRRRGDEVQLVYSDGGPGVSVFEQPGHLDWSSLHGGAVVQVHGRRAWSGDAGGVELVVLERAGVVFAVVGERSPASLLHAAEALPEPPAPSLGDRVRSACRELVRSFGLRG